MWVQLAETKRHYFHSKVPPHVGSMHSYLLRTNRPPFRYVKDSISSPNHFVPSRVAMNHSLTLQVLLHGMGDSIRFLFQLHIPMPVIIKVVENQFLSLYPSNTLALVVDVLFLL